MLKQLSIFVNVGISIEFKFGLFFQHLHKSFNIRDRFFFENLGLSDLSPILANINVTRYYRMENNKEMAEYIYSILLFDPIMLMSWGFQSPRIINQGLSFIVNGFKHKGKVSIQYNEGQDLFDVYLMDETDKLVNTINMVFFDQLVEVIDERVEKTEDYKDRVNNEYFK